MSGSAWQTARVRIYDLDGVNERPGSPIAAKGLRWTDELKGEGGASLTQDFVDDAYAANPDILRAGLAKVEVQLTEGGAWTPVFAFLTTPGSGTLVGPGQDADKAETLQCRGARAYLDDWIVLHDGGFSKFAGDTRSFGFMSIDYDDSGWSTPLEVLWAADTSARAGFPELFQTLLGASSRVAWIGLEDPSSGVLPDGTVRYFRGTYENPSRRKLRFYVVADNYVDFYVNAEPVYLANEAQDAYGWKNVQEPPYERIFPAGTVTMAAKVTNAALTTGDNPVGLIVVVTTVDANGNPDQIVSATGMTGAWVVTDSVTGLTAAQILLRLMSEAETDRDNTTTSYITPTFTAAVDSDGTPWPDLQERAFEIGTKGSQVVEDLESVAFDLDFRPDMTLDAYVNQGADVSALVSLVAGDNLLTYESDGQPMVGTRLLVRINDRWLYLIDASAEAAGSLPREAFLEAGLSMSETQGTSVGEANLGDMARETFAYTASLHADTGCSPYLDFGKGDIITGLNYKGVATDLQVVSISGAPPDDGVVVWTLELREV